MRQGLPGLCLKPTELLFITAEFGATNIAMLTAGVVFISTGWAKLRLDTLARYNQALSEMIIVASGLAIRFLKRK